MINFYLPANRGKCIHRIGCSSRNRHNGVAIYLLAEEDVWYRRDVEQFETTEVVEMSMDVACRILSRKSNANENPNTTSMMVAVR